MIQRPLTRLSTAPLEEALTDCIRRGRRPKAVIAVHLHGQPADMDAITESCARHEVPLIEAAAESLGATLRAALQTRTSG